MDLYERIGGQPGIEAVIGAFYEKVFADDELRPFFENVDVDKLTAMQREFFSAALGGPSEYSSSTVREAHAGRGISVRHLTAFTDRLFETLLDQKVSRTDATGIVNRIATYSEDIVGGVSEDG
jgi:hemoglobin